jgi:hypothetical protein
MTNDLLSQYRKTPVTPKGGTMPPVEANEYVAFGTKDKVHRLRICSASPLVNALGYNLLLNVVSDGKGGGTSFMLVYTVLLVMVKGANLQKMVFAIENGMADFIQEFDPERWQKPTAADAPFIESIEVQVTGDSPRYGDKQH